jgi:hypothetical protein
VQAVGTPAVAHQSVGNYDVFVRGSDRHLYWKSFRRTWLPFEPEPVNTVSAWTSIGCCFGSDPSALSRGDGQIDVGALICGERHGPQRRAKFELLHHARGPCPRGARCHPLFRSRRSVRRD